MQRPAARALVGRSIAAVALVAWSIAAAGQNNVADTQSLIELLQLTPGDVVAEIGAGGGELTLAIARHVGPSGRVISSELGAERVTKLRNAVARSGVPGVEVIEGHELHANLPEGCCDAAFMRNVYHHFGDPATMNASLLRALKPGSRLAIIDFNPPKGRPTAPPGKRGEDGQHGVTADTIVSELTAAGFQIVSNEARNENWFIVVAMRPAN